nr:MAG TPA: hypothetical protein [Microviridae sp.]
MATCVPEGTHDLLKSYCHVGCPASFGAPP